MPPLPTLTCQKHLFSIPENIHYLNCAAQGPYPKAVESLGIEALKRKSQPFQIEVSDYFRPVEELKSAISKLLNIPNPQRIALIPSASYGLATAANNIPLSEGENIVIVADQFPSNYYTWKRVAAEKGAFIKVVAAPPIAQRRGALWNARILKAIDERTKVVTMANIHWSDGTLYDLKTIGKKARNVGAYFILDTSQTGGALPFDVQELKPDALVNVGYKWLLGSNCNSFAYFGEKFDNGLPLEDNWINRKDSDDFASLVNYRDEYREAANRYSMGQTSNFITTPMLTKSIQQVIEWGPENIQAYCAALVKEPIERLRALGCFIEEDAYRTSHLFGVYLNGVVDIRVLKKALLEANVYVSYRGDAVRISPNVYNDANDMNALVEVFEKLSRA